MSRPTSKEYAEFEKAMNRAIGWKPGRTLREKTPPKASQSYGEGHDMKRHGEGKPYGSLNVRHPGQKSKLSTNLKNGQMDHVPYKGD